MINTRALILAVAVAFPMPLLAQSGEAHPAYKHAMANLKAAQQQIDQRRPEDGAINTDEQVIKDQIGFAMGDLHRADLVDGKDTPFPPADQSGLPSGRLHAAEALLRRARVDIAMTEQNPKAQTLQQTALNHIDTALQAATSIMKDPGRH